MRRVKVDRVILSDIADFDKSMTDAVFLDEATHHYVVNVLRMKAGDVLELFDGEGHAWKCSIFGTQPLAVAPLEEVNRDVESPLTIRVYQAIPKGDRWEWFLEKATELGVDEIVPLTTTRSVVTIPAKRLDGKYERWTKIVEGASRQSGRTVTPYLSRPMTLLEAMTDGRRNCWLHFVADPVADEHVVDGRATAGLPSPNSSSSCEIAFWIGPEGGFTEDEIAQLHDMGARSLSFGPRILRSETAGIFAVAAAQMTWGDINITDHAKDSDGL